MLICFLAALVTISPGQKEYQTEDINLKVTISSNVYTYEVTNLIDEKIVCFDIDQHASYNFFAPQNWQLDDSNASFGACTDNTYAGISRNKKAQFSCRVGSAGAVLGTAPLKLQYESGRTLIIPDVWAPAREPHSYAGIFLTNPFGDFRIVGHDAYNPFRVGGNLKHGGSP